MTDALKQHQKKPSARKPVLPLPKQRTGLSKVRSGWLIGVLGLLCLPRDMGRGHPTARPTRYLRQMLRVRKTATQGTMVWDFSGKGDLAMGDYGLDVRESQVGDAVRGDK